MEFPWPPTGPYDGAESIISSWGQSWPVVMSWDPIECAEPIRGIQHSTDGPYIGQRCRKFHPLWEFNLWGEPSCCVATWDRMRSDTDDSGVSRGIYGR